jgi:mRNA-degrading endonuclease RelE of RelBE toxin-antitoxin system
MWTVRIPKKLDKSLKRLPQLVQMAFEALTADLMNKGPVAGNWPNYGKLGENRHHCHLKKGKPTYVSVWWEVRQETQTIEVTYVGTHENAPY